MTFTTLRKTILSGWWNSIVTIVVSHLALLLVVHFLQPCSDTNCRIEEASCSTRGGVNSAFFKFFKDRETFEEFSCKTLLNHRDKSQQHTRDLYWFGLLTYFSPQATPLENSLKTLVKHLTRNKAPWQTPAPVPPFSLPLLQEIISPFTQVQHNL